MNRDWPEQFLRQRRQQLVAHARNICRDASDAEDLVQEASLRFLQKYEGMASPQNELSCASWLQTTIQRLFIDQCRRRKVQAQGAQDPHLSEEAVVTLEPPPQEIYDKVTKEAFAEALQALGPKVRATFELHLTGMKYEDIARVQGIPVGTVGKRIHDARAKLRELLKHLT
ncbi:MAG TPA: RNA polymerase sigma factor [Myxococcaceae bacterium]|jgi:RNA polymerase sigma-70 factor (ECF subfamily)